MDTNESSQWREHAKVFREKVLQGDPEERERQNAIRIEIRQEILRLIEDRQEKDEPENFV